MPGLVTTIEDLTNARTKFWSTSHIVPRGSPNFADLLLKGEVRFAKKLGNVLPGFVAENTTELSEDAFAGRSLIKISPQLSWMEIGFVLSIGPGLELVEVDDIELSDGTISLTSNLISNHAVGDRVALYGGPISFISGYASGATTVQVRSQWRIVPGDFISLTSTAGNLASLVDTRASVVTFLGTTVGGLYNYELTLEKGIFRDVVTDEILYLRCYPAYYSTQLPVRVKRGLFLLDYLSGVLKHKVVTQETAAVTLWDEFGSILTGFDNTIFSKNAVVAYTDMPADALLFWDIVDGSVQWEGDKFLGRANSDGRFRIATRMIPKIPASDDYPKWSIPLYARGSSPVYFSVIFNPGEVQKDISLAPGNQYYLDVNGSVFNDIEEINVSFSGAADSEVLISDWAATGGRATQVQYSVMADVLGGELWQSLSLQLKPLFQTLDDIRFRFDFSTFNNGAVHF